MNGSDKKKLTQKERLKGRNDFLRVLRTGSTKKEPYLKGFICRNGLDYNRIAVVIPKRAGKSHERNYIRRSIKEIYRTNKNRLYNGFDIVFRVYSGDFASQDYERKKEIILSCLKNLRSYS